MHRGTPVGHEAERAWIREQRRRRWQMEQDRQLAAELAGVPDARNVNDLHWASSGIDMDHQPRRSGAQDAPAMAAQAQALEDFAAQARPAQAQAARNGAESGAQNGGQPTGAATQNPQAPLQEPFGFGRDVTPAGYSGYIYINGGPQTMEEHLWRRQAIADGVPMEAIYADYTARRQAELAHLTNTQVNAIVGGEFLLFMRCKYKHSNLYQLPKPISASSTATRLTPTMVRFQ